MKKLVVKSEGREEIYLVEKDDIKEFIKSKKLKIIHNFIPSGPMMIGADHEVESVLEDIDRADKLAILTGSAQANNLGHALALITNEKLEMYDIGKITESDLLVNS